MKINGKNVEDYLNSLSCAELLERDNNDYLISFRLDSGSDIAFDPRTKTKASIFIGTLPEELLTVTGIGKVIKYPPENPSTALKRVSSQLDRLPIKYKVEVQTIDALHQLIESQKKT
ncbi:hypothetical protein [Endozoicomonas sp.]|uniref:hypothetical protein n=1 Tax=Endozoicomonas sp. TaxID=1892382 RepID=UPI0028863ED6|nr:hypothetical protein [Endozoicomonas sp.]